MSRSLLPLATLGLGVIGTATVFSPAQEPKMLNTMPDENAAVLMQAKLASTEKVIEGLMSGHFGRIRNGVDDLATICQAKNWRRLEDQVVVHYRAELMRSSKKLGALAAEQNLDGAAYAFMTTLTTCINCHQYSRDVLRTADRRSGELPVHSAVRTANR